MPPNMNLLDVVDVGRTLANWDRERPRNIALPERRVQLYVGAMEIPLALRPRAFVLPDDDQLTSQWFNLVLDCVAVSANHKLNLAASGEGIRGILSDARKFYADRRVGLGPKALAYLGALYPVLPSATGDTPP